MRNSLFVLLALIGMSCTSTHLKNYYFEHKEVLNHIENQYKQQYNKSPFSLEYSDKNFKDISVEIVTDSIKLIYNFNRFEKKMDDSLRKYGLNEQAIDNLLDSMKKIGCIWVSKLDYYVAGKKNLLVFMSIREKRFHIPLTKHKYYILAYFEQPQYYDQNDVLLNRRQQRMARKIHGDIFRRITGKVAYTISDRFR